MFLRGSTPYSHALPLALLAHAASRHAVAAAACDGVISTFVGDCTYDNFVAALTPGCPLTEIFPSGTDPVAEVAEACAYSDTAFVEIQGTYQRDARYFAGGGPLADGGDWELDVARLRRFEANLGAGTVIGWPEYAARVAYNDEEGHGDNGYPANMNLETGCDLQTVMCCFADDARGDGFAVAGDGTTDVCRHDLRDSPQSSHINQGWSVFPGAETPTHCVGFTWKEGEDALLGNLMYDVSLRNSAAKGYLKGVPGAPMCGCVEHMPVVEEAACRTAAQADAAITYAFRYERATDDYDAYVYATNRVGIAYADCAAGDLKAQYQANHAEDADAAARIDEHLVGAGGCADDVSEYLNEEHFLIQHQHDTKYTTPDPSQWTDIVVGEGVYFMMPSLDEGGAVAEAHFRGLITAGCKDAAGEWRHCLVRRICPTCSESHRDIYYQRHSPLGEGQDFLDLFMNNWVSTGNNMDNGDFELFSSYEDARAGVHQWTYCNYDDTGIGFPRDCGPYGGVGSNWNSYVRGGGLANHHAYYVEKP